MDETAYVCIMASQRNVRRAWEHCNVLIEGFIRRYDCTLLVWYEAFGDLSLARRREFQMKDWRRAWKVREIEGLNPTWEDLYERVALP